MSARSAAAFSRYPLWGLACGAVAGVLLGHPLFMVAHHLHEYFGHHVPLGIGQVIVHCFSLHAWPLTLFFALTGAALGGVLGRLYQRLEEHRHRYQAQLRALAAEMSLAEEKERRRLATELHEQVGQTLAFIQMKVGILAAEVHSPPGVSTLQEVRDHLEESIRYIRSLTGELSPPVLYELGFEAAVAWLARQIQEQYGIEVKLERHPISWPPCNDGQILLFVMVRDLLTYVARQAQPRLVQISLDQEGDQLLLQVEHDGASGPEAPHDPQGFALFSIRERLDRLGGVLEVSSPPGRGAVFTVRVPLCQEHPLPPWGVRLSG